MADLGGGEWVTVNGRHVFIAEGSTLNEALALKLEPSDRMKRAIASQVRTGQKEQAIADRSEDVLSRSIGIPRTRDNSAFDLRNDDVGIECKTLVNSKSDKITMSKTALGRKISEQRADELKAYTVVVDRRSGGMTGAAKYYIKEGLGSFRLGSMTPTTLAGIKGMVRQ